MLRCARGGVLLLCALLRGAVGRPRPRSKPCSECRFEMGPGYLLMGFFDGFCAQASRPRARVGDRVVFDRGRFRGAVTAVTASDGLMQVRVELGGGKVGTQVLGWPAPTPAFPREWELCAGSPRRPAQSRGEQQPPAPAAQVGRRQHSSRRDPRLGVSGPPGRHATGQRTGRSTPPRPLAPPPLPVPRASSAGGSSGEGRRSSDRHVGSGSRSSRHSGEQPSSSRKRSRAQQADNDEAEAVAMQHKCAKYRAKLSASKGKGGVGSAGVDAKATTADHDRSIDTNPERDGVRDDEYLSPQKRLDYENKLKHWENKLRKWKERADQRASAKREKRLKREQKREQNGGRE